MKGNKILKTISKLLLSVCMILAFLCSPITKLFTSVSKVFATTTPKLDDVEGANVRVEGFVSTGTVGSKVKLPRVYVGDTEYKLTENDGTALIYDIKTPAGKSTLANTDLTYNSEDGHYYFTPTSEGVYTLDIHTVSETKLQTVVKGLQINVSKANIAFSVPNSAIIADGESANILPSKITLDSLAGDTFKLDAPVTDGNVSNITLTCIPAGSTGSSDNYTLQYDSASNTYAFATADKTKLKTNAKYGTYTFRYSYVENGLKLGTDITSTCEVVANDSFKDDITLAISALVTSSELEYGEIGKWNTLPTATVYNSKSGSTNAIPAILSIKAVASSAIEGAKIEFDGYNFRADKIGKYQITYTASYPYTGLKVEKNYTIELKDETAPEVLFVGSYDKSAYFTSNTDADETSFVESLTEADDSIKSIYVLQSGKAIIDLPAIYAKDNATDGTYELTREVIATDNQTTAISVDNNNATTFEATAEGVYTVQYTARDSSNLTSVAKRTFLVVSEDTLKSTVDGVNTPGDITKPTITIGTTPRMVESNGNFEISVPTANDAIMSALRDKFTRLKSSSISWSSNVDITATIQGYKADDTKVDTATYTFTKEDINNSKYSISMADHSELNNNDVAYFKVEYTAATDWMTALSLDSATATSSKITYVSVEEDTTASVIALAEYEGQTTLAGIITKMNEDKITEIVNDYYTKNGSTLSEPVSVSVGTNGLISVDTDKYIAPFNQYSAENNYKVKLPNLIIKDKEDSTNLSVTVTITNALGNSKSFLPTFTQVLTENSDANGYIYHYYVSLGEFELASAGQYTITVTATDKGGNISTYSFAVLVNDTASPSDIVLDTDIIGESTISKTYYVGEFIPFPEATVVDNSDEECTYVATLTRTPDNARITSNQYNRGFSTLTAGTYEITYNCEDANGNTFTKVYSLEVSDKDYTTISVDESVFADDFHYVWDDSKAVNEIVIPFGVAMNQYDSEINNTEIKPTVKNANGVTQTVSAKDDNYSFNAVQGVYTVEYKLNNTTKKFTLYIGDTDAPTITWKEEVPSTLKLNDEWGKGITSMFEVTDINNGEKSTITDYIISITDPDKVVTIINGETNYKFSKEGSYTLTITFDDGVNDVKETKTITVSSETKESTTNPTNVVGTILLIVSILIVGGVVVYLILSSKKSNKKKGNK